MNAALYSALTQTLPSDDYEVLLVDDGSTDQTSELAGVFRKRYPNLRYLRFPLSKGITTAGNYGLRAAQGKYLIRLDPMDAFHREILACFVEHLEANHADFIFSDRYEITLADKAHQLIQVEPFNVFRMLLGGTMLRTDLMIESGGYRPFLMEECDLYIRYLQLSQCSPVRVPRPLYYRSRRPTGVHVDERWMKLAFDELADAWGEEALMQFGEPPWALRR